MENINSILEELSRRFNEQDAQIINLKKELLIKEERIKSFPQLSATSFGQCTSDGKIKYRNWYVTQPMDDQVFCDNLWFSQYLKYHFPDEDYKINMFGIYGEHDDVIFKDLEGKKVFFTAEDIEKRYLHFSEKFGYYALDYMDLSLGFDLIEHPNYSRFPYWVLRNFNPNVEDEDIENVIDNLNSLCYEKSKNVALVASHDWGGTRSCIANDVERFTDIVYAGKWRNNSSELWDSFNNNKVEFLKQYKFNICAENINNTGYITEKIFEAIQANCIPLYIGGADYMEPCVLNKKAILTWDLNGDNDDTVELFKTLLFDKKSYDEFRDQNPLLDTSSKFVINVFSKLEKHFERLIYG